MPAAMPWVMQIFAWIRAFRVWRWCCSQSPRGRLDERAELAEVLQESLSVAVKRPGDVIRGPLVPDLLHDPLAGNRVGDLRLPDP